MPPSDNGAPKPKQCRGFAAMSRAKRLSICCRGGQKTAKKYGSKHMAKIGRKGRAVRTRREAKAKLT